MNQRHDADETQKMVTAKSQRIAEEQKECKKLEELARADLATVEPALEEAIEVVIESFENAPPSFQFQTMLRNFHDRSLLRSSRFVYFYKNLIADRTVERFVHFC